MTTLIKLLEPAAATGQTSPYSPKAVTVWKQQQ